MKQNAVCHVLVTAALIAVPLTAAAAGPAPGLYEYTMKMNMPSAPNMPNMPAQTLQHCVTAKDVAAGKGYGAPQKGDNDCKVTDMAETSSTFAYKISCAKPEKLDGAVKGTYTATGMTMDMTMTIPGMPGAMTQNITAKRIGDCKQ